MTDTTKPVHGRIWRLLAHRESGPVTYENQGMFDELVVDDWLHIEQMDDAVWWLRVGDARLFVTLDANGSPRVDVERGVHGAVSGRTLIDGVDLPPARQDE